MPTLQRANRVWPSWATSTRRQPGSVNDLPTQADVTNALGLGDWMDFTAALEDIHDQVHGWVGGHMGNPFTSPNDPLFFVFHTYIDLL